MKKSLCLFLTFLLTVLPLCSLSSCSEGKSEDTGLSSVPVQEDAGST